LCQGPLDTYEGRRSLDGDKAFNQFIKSFLISFHCLAMCFSSLSQQGTQVHGSRWEMPFTYLCGEIPGMTIFTPFSKFIIPTAFCMEIYLNGYKETPVLYLMGGSMACLLFFFGG
jgi:hypothetical protein